jgi:hypothetical protein
MQPMNDEERIQSAIDLLLEVYETRPKEREEISKALDLLLLRILPRVLA